MMMYLKIENPGVCPPDLFTLLGASLTRDHGGESSIGKFGSGCKHGVLVCLRNEVKPIVFCSNLCMEFESQPQVISDSLDSKEFGRVSVKYSGKDDTGATKNSTEKLGFVLEYGANDWGNVTMGLREFVSNAIDYSIRMNGEDGWKSVKIEPVSEKQVRAKAGYTRVFIPMNDEVLNFANNLGRWFLHFSEPENLKVEVLPKSNRNMQENSKIAVIYRRGVLVREIANTTLESVFDYNFLNLDLDECRKADDYSVGHHAAVSLKKTTKENIKLYLNSFSFDAAPKWEHNLSQYSLGINYDLQKDLIRKTWKEAFAEVSNEDAVFCSAGAKDTVRKKGKKAIVVPEGIMKAATSFDLPTEENSLSQDEKAGREVIEAKADAEAVLEFCWELVKECGMSLDRNKPKVKCFRQVSTKDNHKDGYVLHDTIYINSDLCSEASVLSGYDALSDRLMDVMMQQLAYYTTNSQEYSMDSTKWLCSFLTRMAKTAKQVA